jgi:ATP-binding cassette subfamily F protein 3
MLLRPSNTLLLDEPTNHLDIDSKEVLLDALADYGGTLIFVSHDRYFVEKLATKIVDVGDGKATLYPGDYKSFLWSKENAGAGTIRLKADAPQKAPPKASPTTTQDTGASAFRRIVPDKQQSYEDRKKESVEKRKRERAYKALKDRVAELEVRIADREKAIKEVEQTMAAPDFYSDHEKSKPILARHQALMWEVGELLGQWEMLQNETEQYADLRNS